MTKRKGAVFRAELDGLDFGVWRALVFEGLNTLETAHALKISSRQARYHLERVRSTLGIHDQLSIIVSYWRSRVGK